MSAAMVTIDSAAMVVWLTPDDHGPLGERQQDRRERLPPGGAEGAAASTEVGTAPPGCRSAVRRMTGGIA